jgi:hypothetical protein
VKIQNLLNALHRIQALGVGLMALAAVGAAEQRGSTPRLNCTPSVMTPDKTLTLRMPVPHGRELGVRTPQGRFLFIAYQFDEQANPIPPPVPSADFLRMNSIELSPALARGVAVSQRSPAEPVFTTPGRYQFVLSDNLETEDDAHANLTCDVRYRPH